MKFSIGCAFSVSVFEKDRNFNTPKVFAVHFERETYVRLKNSQNAPRKYSVLLVLSKIWMENVCTHGRLEDSFGHIANQFGGVVFGVVEVGEVWVDRSFPNNRLLFFGVLFICHGTKVIQKWNFNFGGWRGFGQ